MGSISKSDHRTPLLGHRIDHPVPEDGPDTSNQSSALCCFDRIGKIFTKHNLAVAAGPLATAVIFLIAKFHGFSNGSDDIETSTQKIEHMLGALVWMAVWWIFEPVPIAITSLLPLVLFPFFEIMDADEVAGQYTTDIVVLMLGTFILALAIGKYDLHKRMALRILLLIGGDEMSPRLVLLGFLGGPAFLSMWMQNTSAAAMMLPMATGLLHNLTPEHHVERSRSTKMERSATLRAEAGPGSGKFVIPDDFEHDDAEQDKVAKAAIHKFGQGVILGVTYGVGLGGMATLIGCGPNLLVPAVFSQLFPGAPPVDFLNWMKFATPLVIVWIVPTWLFLCYRYCPTSAMPIIGASLNRNMVKSTYDSLGKITFAEVFILVEFFVLVVLWITKSFGQSPGWGSFFNNFPGDGTVSVAAAVLLFVVPNGKKDGQMLMNWKDCKEISWSVILLLGAGFALSKGMGVSGVSDWIAINMQFFEYLPTWTIIPVLAILISLVTEFVSNAATATLFLPIFAEISLSINVHPLLLMIPTTFASNSSFILPSGTPPNAMAYGTGYLVVNDMGIPGLFMHVSGILILTLFTNFWGPYCFEDLGSPATSLPWINS